GQHADLMVALDAAGLRTGAYVANLVFETNVASARRFVIPVTLHATGIAEISAPTSLDFGSVGIGASRRLQVPVINAGTALLSVSGITSSDPTVGAAPTTFALAPGETQIVDVTYVPTAAVPLNATLQIQSNATAPGPIPLRGRGAVRPSAGIDPDHVAATLGPNGSTSQAIHLSNVRAMAADLDFEVSTDFDKPGAAPAAYPT